MKVYQDIQNSFDNIMLLTINKNKMIIMLTELYKMLKYNKLYICRKIYIWQAKNKEKE